MKSIKLAALFFISVAGISFELFVMRVFSVGGWSSFGSLVISAALLGVGLSGIILTVFSDWVEAHSDSILQVCALSMAPVMAFSVIAAQRVPFNPVLLAQDWKQLWYIALYYLIYGVPFFINAAFVGIMFISQRSKIQKVYFWNMLGSGVGGFFIVAFMFFIPPDFLLLPVIFVSAAGALFICLVKNELTNKIEISVCHFIAFFLTTIISSFVILQWGGIHVSELKAISYVRKYPDSKLVHHSYAPSGEYHVYYSKYFHFAPGLSDNAALNIHNMPEQPYWGLFIDGSGPIGIMGYLRDNEKEYMDYLPMTAPYTLLSEPNVLLVNLSGGINTQIARYNDARKIDILEPSSEVINILKYDPNITRFTGGLLTEPNVKVIQGEGRDWCASRKNYYDLIELSLVDSVGLNDSGGYPVHEDFKWTVEAFKQYISSLSRNGILSITVWDKLNPPRNVLKLSNSISCAMRELKIQDAEECFFSFGLFMSTTTILVRKTPFTKEELKTLTNFVESRSFDLYYSPNVQLKEHSVDFLMSSYRRQFEGHYGENERSYSNTDMYRSALPQMFSFSKKNIENRYIFDIREITDQRPYYSGFLKLKLLPIYLRHIESVSEEWGYLLLLGMLFQACLFGFIVIIVPLFFIKRKQQASIDQNSPFKTLGVILYYAGLGLGYMLVEIYLIQRLGLFLSNPTYSTSIVITIMLIFSALGNIASGYLKRVRKTVVLVSCIFIALILLFYVFYIDTVLSLLNVNSYFWRIMICILIAAPVSFFMGVPYPNGLDSLQENKPALLPWAWGMNGGLSVAGSALARLISVSSGFNLVLFISTGIYLITGFLFGVNTTGTPDRTRADWQ
ncbi:hypothetical protein AGMMS50212_04440 [Spirochaetia bacterium]|nr:hypothetical protein AGMMS50212_04440 [Spirochaetia bacterium]